MLRQGLILTSSREYAQTMRAGLLELGDAQTRIDVELDSLRAMQLMPQQYDLILLDLMLDAMDGLQLLLLMKQQAPGTKFVLVSDISDETSRAQAYQNGADFFLERPRTPESFRAGLDAIRALLKRLLESQPLRDDLDGPLQNIADIIQTRCLSGDSILLLIRSRHQSGDIFIFRGEVFHAQYPGRSGEAALHNMLNWDDGRVRIKELKLTHVPPRTIEIPYRQLLAQMEKAPPHGAGPRPTTGELMAVTPSPAPPAEPVPSVVLEAPPLEKSAPAAPVVRLSGPLGKVETPLPAVNSHWRVDLSGALIEGSQLADPDRCAFITYFFYRKLADVAVALEVDYFKELTLYGPHLQQVLMADNIGIRHAVFETAWARTRTNESNTCNGAVNKAFEQIAKIQGVIAAAFVSDKGKLAGWCSNTAIAPESLRFIAETCRVILSANRVEQRPAHTGVAVFGSRTLVFREGEPGLFMIYLDSPVNDAVLDWLWKQVNPLLEADGVRWD